MSEDPSHFPAPFPHLLPVARLIRVRSESNPPNNRYDSLVERYRLVPPPFSQLSGGLEPVLCDLLSLWRQYRRCHFPPSPRISFSVDSETFPSRSFFRERMPWALPMPQPFPFSPGKRAYGKLVETPFDLDQFSSPLSGFGTVTFHCGQSPFPTIFFWSGTGRRLEMFSFFFP